MVVFKQEQIQLMFIHLARLMLMAINQDFKKKDFAKEITMNLTSSLSLILNSNLLITMQVIIIIIFVVVVHNNYYYFL